MTKPARKFTPKKKPTHRKSEHAYFRFEGETARRIVVLKKVHNLNRTRLFEELIDWAYEDVVT